MDQLRSAPAQEDAHVFETSAYIFMYIYIYIYIYIREREKERDAEHSMDQLRSTPAQEGLRVRLGVNPLLHKKMQDT